MNIPKLLKVVPLEADMDFPRYVIEDQDESVWNGSDFVVDRKAAALYVGTDDACLVMQDILKKDLSQRVLIRFKAPVVVEVYADPHAIVNPLDVALWLSKTCRLQMNTSENGLGPDNSVVLPTIYFHQIEECNDLAQ